MSPTGLRHACLLTAMSGLLCAQIGQGPVGQGGPGPQGGGNLPLPFPRRGRTNTDAEQVKRFKGIVQKVDDKTIVVGLPDGRVIEFRRSDSTRNYRESKEVAAADLRPGDQVTVEATEDRDGYLYARNVYIGARAPAAKPAGGEPGANAGEDDTGASSRSVVRMRGEDNDPRPVLRRGIPPKRPRTDNENEPEAAAPAAAATAAEAARQPEVAVVLTDPLIVKARATAAAYARQLNSFVCREFMARFVSDTRPVNWRAVDIISVDLVSENGKESYRNLAVNDKPTKKSIDEVGGAWSTGEFVSTLLDLFSPATAADFRLKSESTAAGRRARVFDFRVDRESSHWLVKVASQSINPAYKGSVWIDPATGHVLRIEMQARSLPSEFPLDTIESTVDYDTVRIGGREALLPVHSETLSCQRGSSNCNRNVIDFRNYHKYEAESNIKFEPGKD